MSIGIGDGPRVTGPVDTGAIKRDEAPSKGKVSSPDLVIEPEKGHSDKHRGGGLDLKDMVPGPETSRRTEDAPDKKRVEKGEHKGGGDHRAKVASALSKAAASATSGAGGIVNIEPSPTGQTYQEGNTLYLASDAASSMHDAGINLQPGTPISSVDVSNLVDRLKRPVSGTSDLKQRANLDTVGANTELVQRLLSTDSSGPWRDVVRAAQGAAGLDSTQTATAEQLSGVFAQAQQEVVSPSTPQIDDAAKKEKNSTDLV
ncbi:MAG: hypothetical protein AAF637_03310 [Pseudomonadota bacterium]